MIVAPLPPDEFRRLRALRELALFGTPPEERFDRIARFAAEQFDAPMAFVTLLDETQLWMKSAVGCPVGATARDSSFCSHTILRSEATVVADARLDARFDDNPAVTGDPYVRFYAGVPLHGPGGAHIGAICVVDTKARELDELHLVMLQSLGELVDEVLAGVEHTE